MIKYYTVLLLFFIGKSEVTFGQNQQKVDSLLTILKSNTLSKIEKAMLYESLAYYHPKHDSALFYAKKSLNIASELKNPILEAEAWEQIGHKEKLLGNNSKALNAAFKALKIYETNNLTDKAAAANTQIATHYISEKEYNLAIKYLKESLKIYQKTKNPLNECLTLINLGEAYRLSGNLDEAEKMFTTVLKHDESKKDDVILAYALGNSGMIQSTKKNFQIAIQQLNKAIRILTKRGDSYSTSIYLFEQGKIYDQLENKSLAVQKMSEAIAIAQNAELKEQIRDFSKLLSDFYEREKDYAKALKYQRKYQVYQDSIVNKSNIKKIEQIKAAYVIGQRESEIKHLNEISSKRKHIAIGLAFGTLLFAALTYLLYFLYKRIRIANRNLSKREEEKALLLKELNHRVKNNLQMIASLLNLQSNETTNSTAKEVVLSSKNRVEALSLVHRSLYQEGAQTKVVIKEYIEELVLNLIHCYALYVKPEFNLSVSNLNVNEAIPLGLIINELVTNAMKHAYEGIEDPILRVTIILLDNNLSLKVSDNGKGCSKIDTEKTDSLGYKLILSLIEQLEGTYTITHENGTHWIINLKI